MNMDCRKILIVSSDCRTVLNFRFHLIHEFRTRNLDVTVYAPKDEFYEQLEDRLSAIGGHLIQSHVRNTSLNPFADIRFLCDLIRLMRQIKPDYIFAYTIKPVIYASLAARILGIQNAFSMIAGVGHLFMSTTLKSKILRSVISILYKQALKKNKAVFFQNKDDQRLLLSLGIVRSSQCVLVNGSGVDLTLFSPQPFPKQLTFIFMGRLIRDKGIHDYLGAARVLKRKYPAILFKVAGGRHSNPTSLSESEYMAMLDSEDVSYLGDLSDVRPAIQESSVFVLPSLGEGTPRAALESMAMGRPVITTDAPGCREVVIDGKNGFLIPPQNVTSLIEAMEKFIQSPELVDKMGHASRQLAEERFDVRQVNATILKAMALSE